MVMTEALVGDPIGRKTYGDHAAQALGVDAAWQNWPPSYGWWLELRERIGVEA